MTDKKITDSEIVKALEGAYKIEPTTMFFITDYNTNKITTIGIGDIVDLINRLQAEKDTMQHYIDHLKAENERLKKSNEMFTDIGKMYSEIKAEAYKEFAERVKEFMHNKFKDLDEYEFEYITERDIDHLTVFLTREEAEKALERSKG